MAASRPASRQEARGDYDPVDLLAHRSRRLANVVVAISRRRNVREFRAKLLVLLLDLRCPLGTHRLRRSWYVPGAVARLGAEGLRRAWRGYFGEEPMSERTFRSHLTALEQGLAIVRAPGDWLFTMRDPARPEVRPRFPTTFHVIDSEDDAAWWSTRGSELLSKHPRARSNPDTWAKHFGEWRRKAREERESLFMGVETMKAFACDQAPPAKDEEKPASKPVEAIAATLRTTKDPLEVLGALHRAGVRVKGRVQLDMVRDATRLAGAAGLLAIALARGDRVRDRAAWLVRAFRHASPQELFDAWQIVRRHHDARAWVSDPRRATDPPRGAPKGRLLVLPSSRT